MTTHGAARARPWPAELAGPARTGPGLAAGVLRFAEPGSALTQSGFGGPNPALGLNSSYQVFGVGFLMSPGSPLTPYLLRTL
jgi:hypothetical protein